MQIKKGVILLGLHPKMQIANSCASVIWSQAGRELVVTEGVVDRDTGLHPLGRACDYRTFYFSSNEIEAVANMLRDRLDDDYDVVVEDDHIHCEYDPTNPKII